MRPNFPPKGHPGRPPGPQGPQPKIVLPSASSAQPPALADIAPEPEEPQQEVPATPEKLPPGVTRRAVAYGLSWIPANGSIAAGYAVETVTLEFGADRKPRLAGYECSNPTDRSNAKNLYGQKCGERMIHANREAQADPVIRGELAGQRDPKSGLSDEQTARQFFAGKLAEGKGRAEYVLEQQTPQRVRAELVRELQAAGWSAWVEADKLIAAMPRERRARKFA